MKISKKNVEGADYLLLNGGRERWLKMELFIRKEQKLKGTEHPQPIHIVKLRRSIEKQLS